MTYLSLRMKKWNVDLSMHAHCVRLPLVTRRKDPFHENMTAHAFWAFS
jgi:hypothetical protein